MHNNVKMKKAEMVETGWQWEGGWEGWGILIPLPPNTKASFSLSSLS